jgi:hypothetical protein
MRKGNWQANIIGFSLGALLGSDETEPRLPRETTASPSRLEAVELGIAAKR